MLGMWHVWDIGCWGFGMFGWLDVRDVGCVMFGLWDVQDVGCLGCGVFRIWNVRDVGCWGCVIFGMWDVDLQNAGRFFPSFQFIGCIQRNPSRLTLKQLGRKDFSME